MLINPKDRFCKHQMHCPCKGKTDYVTLLTSKLIMLHPDYTKTIDKTIMFRHNRFCHVSITFMTLLRFRIFRTSTGCKAGKFILYSITFPYNSFLSILTKFLQVQLLLSLPVGRGATLAGRDVLPVGRGAIVAGRGSWVVGTSALNVSTGTMSTVRGTSG